MRINTFKVKVFAVVFVVTCFVIYKIFTTVNSSSTIIGNGVSSPSASTGMTVPVSPIRKICFGETTLCDKLDKALHSVLASNINGHRVIPSIYDFDKQPCVSSLRSSPDLLNNGECVRTLWRSEDELLESESKCVKSTITGVNARICVYNSTKDKFISASITGTGAWEGGLVFNIIQLLKKHKGSMFLDLGCNIGSFTLAVASGQTHVVAVDPLLDNLELLSKSLHVSNLTENVTLVWNGVTSQRKTVTLRKYVGNVGGTAIKFETSDDDNVVRESVNTIKLDDLQELFVGKPTIIKMDVETQELNVLLSGQLFFQTIDVKVVLMEYNLHRDKSSGIEIITFMEGQGFKPFADSDGQKPLLMETRRRWPGDVFFLKV